MKDAVITVRLPRATRSRVERLARAERRSLSQQVEHLIETAMASQAPQRRQAEERRGRSLARSVERIWD
jgi:predicted transcriptional regulator